MNTSLKEMSTKTIVITGASSGVGKAMALELAQHGAKLVLAARRKEALDELAAECNQLGGLALAVPGDMRSLDAIHQLASQAFQFGGSIDVWINNAGVLAAGALEEIPAEVNESVIRTNLLGYIHSAHTVLPYFKEQGYGILINNISVGGWFPTPYGAAYTASKFGLRGFSESLKGEMLAYPDIHICDLYPGFLDTPGMQHAANYTGKMLKPAPPVYDPRKVARAVVTLINNPKPQTTVGASALLLRLAFQLFPALTRTITASVIRTYLKQASPMEHQSGNILQTVPYGTSADGGWRKGMSQSMNKKAGLVAAGVAGVIIGALLLGRK
ncbi:SDR family oxidoreductase [Longitalea luteola]|uniref:SDR family oxidoreductase n=1 Tax=Longitalea luteola TaxID=2812563 RepID=UPI001A96CF52|nr:SDR family oxidoreductase [Longitalea luteola]